MTNPNFFVSAPPLSLSQIAEKTGSSLKKGANAGLLVDSASPIEAAASGSISFLDNVKYIDYLVSTSASAVFCSQKHSEMAPDHLSVLIHANPYQAYAQTLRLLYPTHLRPSPITGETAISAGAHICKGVKYEENVIIEAGCVIGENVAIGAGSHILAGAVIGSNVQIGRNCTVGAGAIVIHSLLGNGVIIHNGACIGQDGFGYVMGPGGHMKIPQVGRVIIQDDVEIGANTTIDRGANRDTIIGEGSKIDNLVQIAHNVVLGRHCVIIGQVGISGSTTLGDFVVVAGQSGIVGHVNIGMGAQIGGGSRVHRDVDAGEKVMGYPSIPADLWMRQTAKISREARNWKKKKGPKGK